MPARLAGCVVGCGLAGLLVEHGLELDRAHRAGFDLEGEDVPDELVLAGRSPPERIVSTVNPSTKDAT